MEHFYDKIQGWFDYQDLYKEIATWLPKDFIFAEVGSWKGQSIAYFAVEIVNLDKPGTIYAVDHWKGSEEHVNPYSAQYEPLLQTEDGLYNLFLDNISPVRERISVIKKPSIEAAKDIQDNTLDAIFIDAGHSYEDVIQDLIVWYPKLKQNSYFCGHDYYCDGVNKAVKEFSESINKKDYEIVRGCWIIK